MLRFFLPFWEHASDLRVIFRPYLSLPTPGHIANCINLTRKSLPDKDLSGQADNGHTTLYRPCSPTHSWCCCEFGLVLITLIIIFDQVPYHALPLLCSSLGVNQTKLWWRKKKDKGFPAWLLWKLIEMFLFDYIYCYASRCSVGFVCVRILQRS